jgi:leader peptidase (prepilin peptidase)/N-methyltransferase
VSLLSSPVVADERARIAGVGAVTLGIDAAMAWRFGWSPPLLAYCYFGAVAAVVSATDLVARCVPNRVVVPAYLVGPMLLAAASGLSPTWWPLARAGIAMAVLTGFYLAIGLAVPAGMGLGDVKWAGVVGLYLGWLGWSAVSTGTLVAFAAAALLVITRPATSGRRGAVVPMAPFMTAGALVAVLFAR